MNTGKCFSFTRLGWLLRRDFMENWKAYLIRFSGPYAAIICIMLIGYLKEPSFGDFSEMICGLFTAYFFIGGIVSASSIMEVMNTQQKRVSFLMLPATLLEKFVARALLVSVGFVGMMIVAMLLAEATRFLLLPFFELPDAYYQSVLPELWNNVTDVQIMGYDGQGAEESYQIASLTIVLGWLTAALWYSFFILGGCTWYKHALWKTLGVITLVNVLLGIGLVGVAEWMIESGNGEKFQEWILTQVDGRIPVAHVFYPLILLVSLALVLVWWLSYKKFMRSQVIEPKFSLL